MVEIAGGKVIPGLVNRGFGTRMSFLRRSKRISQADMGKMIGLSRGTISNLEAGEQNVLLYQAFAVAAALDTPLDMLLPEMMEVSTGRDTNTLTGEGFLKVSRMLLDSPPDEPRGNE